MNHGKGKITGPHSMKWAGCQDQLSASSSRRRSVSLDIPFYRTRKSDMSDKPTCPELSETAINSNSAHGKNREISLRNQKIHRQCWRRFSARKSIHLKGKL